MGDCELDESLFLSPMLIEFKMRGGGQVEEEEKRSRGECRGMEKDIEDAHGSWILIT